MEKKIMANTVMGKRIRQDKSLGLLGERAWVKGREKHSFTSLIWSAPSPLGFN